MNALLGRKREREKERVRERESEREKSVKIAGYFAFGQFSSSP